MPLLDNIEEHYVDKETTNVRLHPELKAKFKSHLDTLGADTGKKISMSEKIEELVEEYLERETT